MTEPASNFKKGYFWLGPTFFAFFFLFTSLQGAGTTARAQTADPSLIGYWKLDEGSGLIANDFSGYNHSGTLVNGPVWTTGKVGGALNFDGSNDRVDIGTTFDISALPFTISAWVNPTNYNYYRQILAKRDGWSASDMRFQFDLNKTTGNVRLLRSGSAITFSYTPPVNVWTHLAVVAHSGGTDLYVNGVLRQHVSTVFSPGSDSAAATSIGNLPNGTEPFVGGLDEIRVYNRALSAQEILGIY